jgi:hypothetical protein
MTDTNNNADDKPVEQLTAAEAGDRLAQMTNEFRAAETAKAQAKMTDRQRAAAAMEAKYADPEWRARFNNGGAAERLEWEGMVAAQAGDDGGRNTVEDIAAGRAIAPSNEVNFDGEISTKNKMATAETLREIGILPGGIAAVLRGDEFDAADVASAKAWLDEAARTPEFVKNLMAGEPTVVREFTARCALIAGGAKE